MKLSGIVHYMMPYCTSYFKFLSAWFWGVPEQNKNFATTTYGGGTHLLSATPLRPLNRISWNFQELFTTWCHTAPPISNFYPHDFGVSQSKTRTLPYKTWGSGGYHFVSIAHSISSFETHISSLYSSYKLIKWCFLFFLHMKVSW